MAMTPDEIRSTSFSTVKKGLDPEKVSQHLAAVAEEVQRLNVDVEEARSAAQSAQTEIENARAEVVAANQALQAAQADAAASEGAGTKIEVVGSHVDEVLAAAQRSAEAIVRDAEEWSTAQRSEADAYAQQVRSEVDELRRTTELQAESFREETVSYADRIREDAEEAAASTRRAAEIDALAQYDKLTEDARTRMSAVQLAERELLTRLNVTTEDLTEARDHFQSAVDGHEEADVAPLTPQVAPADSVVEDAPSSDPWSTADDGGEEELAADVPEAETVDTEELAQAAPVEAVVEDVEAIAAPDDSESDSGRAVVDEPDAAPDAWAQPADVSTDEESVEEIATDEPAPWAPSDEAPDAWAEPAEGTEAAPEGWDDAAGDEAPDAWAPAAEAEADEAPDAWAPAAEADEAPDAWGEPAASGTVTSWASGEAVDTFVADAPVATAGEEAQEGAETDSSFFNGSAETATAEDDPLAAMVRQAVERVTDGDGAN